MKIESYLFFNGTSEEAMNFYAKAIGAKIQFVMRFKETPPDVQQGMPGLPKSWAEKIMHACFTVGETMVMVSDVHESLNDGGKCVFGGFALSLAAKDVAETKRLHEALSRGGKVTMPVGPAFWGSPAFGMCVDKFGVSWMVSAPAAKG